LIEPIENGYGKINVDNSVWLVRCDDCGMGCEKVKVVGVVLVVTKM